MARVRTLWVIDPSVHHAEDQGVAEVLRGWDGSSRLFRPALRPGDGPGPDTGFGTDGIVLLGSAASVHDAPDWMRSLAAWVRPVLEGRPRIPLLGVCFGHQLVAHLSGAEVDYVSPGRAKIAGIRTTRLKGGRLLPGEHALRVVASHCEEVKGVPAGYRVTARREDSPIDGLEHETLPVFTFQFHPEAREEFARRAGFVRETIDDRVREDSRRVLAAFLAQVRGEGPRR